jgi:MFS family permease
MTHLADRGRRAAAFLQTQPFYWREAALCAPAMPILLLAGLLTGHLSEGAIAAGAAFSVGFGAARDMSGRRWTVMIAAMLGMTLAAFLGCLVGQWLPGLLILSGAAAAACAVLALIDENLWWIALQLVIALFVAGYYSGPPAAAAERAGVVLAGGLVQVLVTPALAKLWPQAARPLPPSPPLSPSRRRLLVAHGARAALCVIVATIVARELHLANGYWAPMTAMLVLKPGLSETHTRGVARLTGTIFGGACATLFALAVAESQAWLLVGVGVAATAAFALQRAHYAVLTSAITAAMVLLLTEAHGGGVLENAAHRLIATALGGALALVVARIAPHQPLAEHPAPDRVGSRA